MKNKIKTLMTFLIATMLSFYGCKKDDDTNLQPKGNYGNANVTSQTFSAPNWDNNTYNWNFTTTIQDASITQSILSAGIVLVYWTQPNFPVNNVQLEYTWIVDGVGTEYIMQSVPYLGGISLSWTFETPNNPSLTGQSPVTYFGGTPSFKIVCISAPARISHPNVNYKNYSEVKQAFNLKD